MNDQKNKNSTDSILLTKKTPVSYIKKLLNDCSKCGHCCSYSSGFFLEDDIKKISFKLGMKKEDFINEFLEEIKIFNSKVYKSKLKNNNNKKKLNYGECVFLNDKKECTIHEIKPFHCKIASGCEKIGEQIYIWFMLNYLVNPNDPESIRQWATYLETHETIPGGKLIDLVGDREKLSKILNYEILK
ncbi:MAG: YkgJ family cysteine cluster protein [Candidatus Woesearchaeota archaeon]